MAKQYNIRWKQGDYIKLGKAVAEFNRKISKIQTEENKMYLPAFEKYEWQFNRVINSLKRFSQERC